MSKKCSCCGANLEDNALFCTVCGQRQKKNQNAEPQKEVRLKGQSQEQKAKQEDSAGKKLDADKKAKISMVLGIVTWVLLFTPAAVLSLVTDIVGIVFGVQAKESSHRKMVRAGLVLNGFYIGLILIALLIVLLSQVTS